MKNSAVKEMMRKQFPSCHSFGVLFQGKNFDGFEEFSVVMYDSFDDDHDNKLREFKLKLKLEEVE